MVRNCRRGDPGDGPRHERACAHPLARTPSDGVVFPAPVGDVESNIERWLRSAESAREWAREARARAATAEDPAMAARYERQADLHLNAAARFEHCARRLAESRALVPGLPPRLDPPPRV